MLKRLNVSPKSFVDDYPLEQLVGRATYGEISSMGVDETFWKKRFSLAVTVCCYCKPRRGKPPRSHILCKAGSRLVSRSRADPSRREISLTNMVRWKTRPVGKQLSVISQGFTNSGFGSRQVASQTATHSVTRLCSSLLIIERCGPAPTTLFTISP